MKQVFACFVLLFVLTGKSAGQETVRLFLNEKFESTDSLSASFYREVSIIDDHYHVKDFTISGEVVHYGEYISINPWIEDGLVENYSEPGVLYSKGYYENGQLTGEWLFYNNIEQTVDTVYYDWDKIYQMTGDCYEEDKKLKYNWRDSREIQKIIDSFSEFFLQHIRIPASTKLHTLGYSAGIYFVLEDNGMIRCLNIHRVDDTDLVSEIQRVVSEFSYTKKSKKPLKINVSWSFDDHETSNETEVNLQLPTFLGKSLDHFYDYLYSNIEYPDDAGLMGVQGTVLVYFDVETDGSVSNVKLLKRVHPLIDNEVIKAVKSSPAWEPGKRDGEVAVVPLFIPVHFHVK